MALPQADIDKFTRNLVSLGIPATWASAFVDAINAGTSSGGQSFPPSNDLSFGGFKLTNLGTPSSSTDASTKAYADLRLALTGGTLSGPIAMGNSKITGLATPTNPADASTKAYADSVIPSQTGNSGKFLTTNGSATSWGTPAGGGGGGITTPFVRYQMDTGGGSYGTDIVFNIKMDDAVSPLYSTTTGLYTAPANGVYQFAYKLTATQKAWSNTEYTRISLAVNGAPSSYYDIDVQNTIGATYSPQVAGTFVVKLSAGDTVGIRYHGYGSAPFFTSDATLNYMTIIQVN